MARAGRLDLRTFQKELASRLATKTAAQVESSRLGLSCGGVRWLIVRNPPPVTVSER